MKIFTYGHESGFAGKEGKDRMETKRKDGSGAWDVQSGCRLCPRECMADRAHGETGYCGMSMELTVARAALHFWEEPCICAGGGSGTVFFSGCTLQCVFCQNYEIAAGTAGKRISSKRLVEIFWELKEQGAENINLVTAGHFLPLVAPALYEAKAQGLDIPIVYNTGGYEKAGTLRQLEGLVDIWLPDYKYRDGALAQRYSHCADYPKRAHEALAEMVRQAGAPVFDGTGRMKKGVIVRHLVLPGCVADSKDVLDYLHDTWGVRIWTSILSQYTPLPHVGTDPNLGRRVTDEEYEEVVDYACFLGMKQVYIQEGVCAEACFIPAFDGTGV